MPSREFVERRRERGECVQCGRPSLKFWRCVTCRLKKRAWVLNRTTRPCADRV